MIGKCYYCEKEINTRTAKRHIKTCATRLEALEESKKISNRFKEQFILKITDKYRKDIYCLYLAIDEMATLKDLDKFLRDIWVECCGHLSAFKINGQQYYSDCQIRYGFNSYDEENDLQHFNINNELKSKCTLEFFVNTIRQRIGIGIRQL